MLQLVILVVRVLLLVLFLLNVRNLLLAVSPQNRRMSPDQVWLNFIPIFNLYWLIRTVMGVRDSARSEFQSRGWPAGGDFYCGIGLAMGVLHIVYDVLYFFIYVLLRSQGLSAGGRALGGLLILIFLIVGLADLILWIVYWARTSGLKNQLARSLMQPMPLTNSGYPVYGPGPGGYPQHGPAPAAAPSSRTPQAEQEAPSVCAGCGAALNIYARCTACGMPVPKKQDS